MRLHWWAMGLLTVATTTLAPTASQPLVVAVNPRTHAAYVANNSSGTVSVITRHCRI